MYHDRRAELLLLCLVLTVISKRNGCSSLYCLTHPAMVTFATF